MLVVKRRPPTISTEVQYKDIGIHHPIVSEKPLDCKNCSQKIKSVNQTAGTLSTQNIELVYASISLCLDIIKIHRLCIVLALVIVGHSDHNLF